MTLNHEHRHELTGIYSAHELMAVELPEPKWALPGLLPEGVSLLVGAPKLGKSLLVLNLAIAVATGGTALGLTEVEQGSVLYAALEDSNRRMQSRLARILGDEPAPTGLFITHHLERGEGMIAQLEQWLALHNDARLIIIDVLGRVATVNRNNEYSYQAAYDTIAPLKQLADEYGVAIVLVHHTRKGKDEDAFKEVSGSGGWVGAADTVIVLRRARNSANVEMHLTGRDVAEGVWNLVFDAKSGTWTVSGEPPWVTNMNASRRRIFEHLMAHGEATPKEIAEALADLKLNTVQRTVRRMAEDGQLHTDGSGHYRAVDVSVLSAVSVDNPEKPGGPRTSVDPGSLSNPSDLSAQSATSVTTTNSDDHGQNSGTDTTDTTDSCNDAGTREDRRPVTRIRIVRAAPKTGTGPVDGTAL